MKERIMAGGSFGTGKTKAWLDIAANCPDSKFYVIDPDDGVKRVWYTEEFKNVKNIEYYSTPRWFTTSIDVVPKVNKDEDPNCYICGVADAWETIKPKIKKGDWIIVEHLHLLWQMVQSAFADEVFGKSIGKYFLQARKSMDDNSKRLDALQGWVDWPVINKLHNDDFIIPICFENPAHVFMTTSVSMGGDNSKEDKDLKSFYGESTIRLEGQKHNPYRAQTILLFKHTGSMSKPDYKINTFLKDRGRKFLVDRKWNDFYFEYLVETAGWS